MNDRLDTEQTLEVLDVLNIIPHLPSFQHTALPLLSHLISSISRTASNDARAAFLASPSSPAQVLGAALVAFSRIAPSQSDSESLHKCVGMMIEGFSWHRGVMHGIAALQFTEAAFASPITSSTTTATMGIYEAILPNLLSEDSMLRLSSLQIAASLLRAEHYPVASDLIQRCIEVEEMPLSVQGAREKSMKVRKLGIVANGQLGRDGEDAKLTLAIVLRYLTGSFLDFPPSSIFFLSFFLASSCLTLSAFSRLLPSLQRC